MAVEEEALCFVSSSCNYFTTFLSQGDYFFEIEFRIVTQFWGMKNIFYWLIRKDSHVIPMNIYFLAASVNDDYCQLGSELRWQ